MQTAVSRFCFALSKISIPSSRLLYAKFKAGGRPYDWFRKSWNDSLSWCQCMWAPLTLGCMQRLRSWCPNRATVLGTWLLQLAPVPTQHVVFWAWHCAFVCFLEPARMCLFCGFFFFSVKWVDNWESTDKRDKYWCLSCWDLGSKYLSWKTWIMVMLDTANRSAFLIMLTSIK